MLTVGHAVRHLTILSSSDSVEWLPLYSWNFVAANEEKRVALTVAVAVTSVRLLLAGAQESISGLPVLSVSEIKVLGCESHATVSVPEAYTYSKSLTPIISSSLPARGSTAGGTAITLSGAYPEPFTADKISVTLCGIQCTITSITSSSIQCTTGQYGPTDETHSGVCQVLVTHSDFGLAAGGVTYRYVDLWSRKTSWGGHNPPAEGDSVVIPKGATILLDISPPKLVSMVLFG